MIDWLYDELDESMSVEFDEHLAGCARCREELVSLQHTREAVRELPDLEPPAALSAILLHEAAKRVPVKRAIAIATEDDRPGVLAWLANWFAPLVRHPAAAAIATLVLVAGVAGSLYLREVKVTEPRPTSAALPPTAVELPSVGAAAPASSTDTAVGETERGERSRSDKDGYEVQLADQGDFDSLDSTVAPDPTMRAKLEKAPEGDLKQNQGKPLEIQSERKAGMGKKADLAFDGSLANAVSGADELVDLEEANQDAPYGQNAEGDGVLGGTAVAGKTARDFADPPAPKAKPTSKNKAVDRRVASQTSTTPANQRVSVDSSKETVAGPQAEPQQTYGYRNPKVELEWAQTESRKLAEALRGQRCRDAARIANDILDRNPDYYYQNIERSKEIKKCQWYVGDERDRRARQRSKARPKKAAPASPMDADMAVE